MPLRVAHQRDAEEGEECVRALQASDSDDSSGAEAPTLRSSKVVKGAGLGLVIAALIGTVFVMSGSTESPKSAHNLLQSKEFHHAVRERVLLSASQNGQSNLDVKEVDTEITQSMDKVLTHLEKEFPEVSQKLKGALSSDQQKALLTLLERQHDKRLKALGEKAIQVVLANALFGPKAIREQLVATFRKEVPDLQKLYKEIVPSPIRTAKKEWYAKKAKSASPEEKADGGWEFLLHPKSLDIMKSFGSFSIGNQTSGQLIVQTAERRLTWEQPLSVKLGVGITGFVLDSVNTLVIELSQLLKFDMPWWGWLLTLLPGVSLGTTSCLIAPVEKFYNDFWCVDFLMFTGLQALEVTINQAWSEIISDD